MEEKQKITACIIAYKEEKNIKDLIYDIKDLADEVVLIYDGLKPDKTIERAKKECLKFRISFQYYLRQRKGHCEDHRVFSFKKARSDWIMKIDGDERLRGGIYLG